MRDYAGKKPRQCMVGRDTATVGLNLSLSSDTLKQLKDRRKNRTSRRDKNPGILRFGSLSVKVNNNKSELLSCPNWDTGIYSRLKQISFLPLVYS